MSIELALCGGVFLILFAVTWKRFVQPFFAIITRDVVNHMDMH